MTNPRITVAIGCYNFEEYIEECIESVLAQTLPPFEIIIGDDHSTDRSWEIIQKYQKKYPHLIKAYRNKKNLGSAQNSNRFRKLFNGDYHCIIDGDDRWLPRKLEMEWRALQKNPEAQIAYSNVYLIDSKGNRIGIWHDSQGPELPTGDVFVEVFSKRFLPDKNNRSVFRNELVTREVYLQEGQCDENLINHWDWDKKLRYTARFKVAYSGEPLVEYRIHDKGIHNMSPEKQFKSILSVYKKNLPLLSLRTKEEIKMVKKDIGDLLFSILPVDIDDINNLLSDSIYEIDSILINRKGEYYFLKRDFKKALDLFKKAIDLNPNYSIPYNNIGVIYWNKGEFKNALNFFKKALEIDPNNKTILKNCKDAITILKDFDKGDPCSITNPNNLKVNNQWDNKRDNKKPINKDNYIKNRLFVRQFLINSLPKSGTHLVAKAISLFPGIHFGGVNIDASTTNLFKRSENFDKETVIIGVDSPRLVSLNAIKDSLKILKTGSYGICHIPYSEKLKCFFEEIDIKLVLILRDPRDVVVSHAKYIANEKSHFLYDLYKNMTESERIITSITGINNGKIKLLNINERFLSVIPWKWQSITYTTYFERLIGPKGGGTIDLQYKELRCIANHLNITYNDNDIYQIADHLFGGTKTFRKGIIGNWKDCFTNEHKELFKQIAGHLLIELGYENDYDW